MFSLSPLTINFKNIAMVKNMKKRVLILSKWKFLFVFMEDIKLCELGPREHKKGDDNSLDPETNQRDMMSLEDCVYSLQRELHGEVRMEREEKQTRDQNTKGRDDISLNSEMNQRDKDKINERDSAYSL